MLLSGTRCNTSFQFSPRISAQTSLVMGVSYKPFNPVLIVQLQWITARLCLSPQQGDIPSCVTLCILPSASQDTWGSEETVLAQKYIPSTQLYLT